MTILSGSSLILDEYNVDVFIASDTKNHLFDIPYTIYYDGDKVSIFNYKILRYSTNTKVDIKFNDMIIRILIGTEIGVPENYVKAIPDLFICFENKLSCEILLQKGSDVDRRSDFESECVWTYHIQWYDK